METKTCPSCNNTLSVDQFNWKIKKRGIRWHTCRKCSREYARNRYHNDESVRQYYLDKAAKRNAIENNENRTRLYEWLSCHSCVDCGNSNPIVLEFDHVKGEKSRALSDMVHRSSWETIKNEIQKCEIRCANCHRIKTARERGYYKYISS